MWGRGGGTRAFPHLKGKDKGTPLGAPPHKWTRHCAEGSVHIEDRKGSSVAYSEHWGIFIASAGIWLGEDIAAYFVPSGSFIGWSDNSFSRLRTPEPIPQGEVFLSSGIFFYWSQFLEKDIAAPQPILQGKTTLPTPAGRFSLQALAWDG